MRLKSMSEPNNGNREYVVDVSPYTVTNVIVALTTLPKGTFPSAPRVGNDGSLTLTITDATAVIQALLKNDILPELGELLMVNIPRQ